MNHLTPHEIVTELNRHIVGQTAAKRAVAIALRNRWRRQQVNEKLRQEILPKNILMIGPTGVGKTEIALRLAKLSQAPFIKVEATKFTEVGYVGRDVDQIIRDLVDMAIHQAKQLKREEVKVKAAENAAKRILNALVGKDATPETREKFATMLEAGNLDEKEIEIEVVENTSSHMPSIDIPGMPGAQVGMFNLGDLLGKSFSKPTKLKRLSVKNARELLIAEESESLLDQETLIKEAIHHTENNGIVFLDEIDKICSRSERHEGGVSREGVQRDLLPLIEGTTVTTKHGPVNTDHILFIASGAFHLAKPSDLLPELQGRLPNRVEMNPLTASDFVQILTEPEASLLKQYKALLETEQVTLTFDTASIEKIAELAADINQRVENIGARRLHTLLEKLLETISFDAANYTGKTFHIDEAYVQNTLESLAHNTDLSKFIL